MKVAQLCPTFCDLELSTPERFEVGGHSLLQGIFQTQGLNPGLWHYRWILYQLSYQGSPRILECIAYSFSRGSSQPRNQTGLSCIAGRFLYQLSYQGSPNNDIYIVYKFQCKICSIISREWREPVSVI